MALLSGINGAPAQTGKSCTATASVTNTPTGE
jgi:hypothetical protein